MSRTRPRTLSILLLAGVVAVTLSACAAGADDPATTSTPVETRSPLPDAEPPVPTVVPATLPTDCNTLGTEYTRQEAVGDMTLQGDGTGFVRSAPANAQLALGCDWIIEEVAGVLLLISTAEPAEVLTAAEALPAQGWTCGVADDFGASYCSIAPPDTPGVEDVVVARDGVWIYLETYNRNVNDFLSEIAAQIWS